MNDSLSPADTRRISVTETVKNWSFISNSCSSLRPFFNLGLPLSFYNAYSWNHSRGHALVLLFQQFFFIYFSPNRQQWASLSTSLIYINASETNFWESQHDSDTCIACKWWIWAAEVKVLNRRERIHQTNHIHLEKFKHCVHVLPHFIPRIRMHPVALSRCTNKSHAALTTTVKHILFFTMPPVYRF